MADKKISQLTALSAANVASATDVLAIVDTSATETKKITAKDLIDGALNGGTANGVLYLNGSKVATSGSALVFDGTNLGIGVTPSYKLDVLGSGAAAAFRINNATAGKSAMLVQSNGATAGIIGLTGFVKGDSSTNLGFFAETGFDLRFYTNGSATEKAVIDTSGNLGIGTASPAAKLDVNGAGLFRGFLAAYYNENIFAIGSASLDPKIGMGSNSGYRWSTRIKDVGSGDGEYVIRYEEGPLDAVTISRSGNLGLGVTPSAWNSDYKALNIGSKGVVYGRVGSQETAIGANWYRTTAAAFVYASNGFATFYAQDSGNHTWHIAPNNTSGAGATASFTQALTLDSSGNLGIGVTSPTVRLDVAGSGNTTSRARFEKTGTGKILQLGADRDTTAAPYIGSESNHDFSFITNNTERGRFTAAGDFLVGKQTAGDATIAGCQFGTYGGILTRVSGDPLTLNRQTDDGIIVSIRQDNVEEGTISVSGNTVSYNAFAGSHWSQLQDGSKPDILRGTVMESINELCVWPGESNERLPKAKISDTAGSKKVYGVFMAWDNDWTETNDMYVTAVGAFICRVNSSVTVQEGDLLESNGDGTARVQADDIIRSSTIGKVTSTVKTHQYDDDSYCVPTVLYCG